jgi:mannan endo-1,4-beta-mannosidase
VRPPARTTLPRVRVPIRVLALALLVAGCADPPHADVVPVDPPMMGAYVPSGVWNDLGPLRALESEVGRPFDVAHWFTSWEHAFDPVPTNDLFAAGRLPLISWQPERQSVADIAAGEHDAYVRAWARDVARAPGLVYVRPFPEMNGDWVPWNGDPTTFRAAWRHIASLFAEEGADNVRWVFSPNVTDEPRTEANRMELYYPGDDVVDLFGLSGYNWGTTRPHIGWRSFETIFERAYERVTALGPYDVWIAEIASSEEGGDKSAWVRDMFASTAFPAVRAIVWFDENKEADWRLRSRAEVIEAFREALGTDSSFARRR